MLPVVSIDLQRRFKFSKRVAPSAEHYGQPVGARGRIELVLVAVRNLGEFFPLIFFQIQIHRIAEARPHRPVRVVGDPQNIHVGVILAFFFVEFQRFRRNLHRQVHARHVRRGVEIRHLQRAVDGAHVGSRRAQLQLLLQRLPLQRIHRRRIAISAARTHIHSAAIQFHF